MSDRSAEKREKRENRYGRAFWLVSSIIAVVLLGLVFFGFKQLIYSMTAPTTGISRPSPEDSSGSKNIPSLTGPPGQSPLETPELSPTPVKKPSPPVNNEESTNVVGSTSSISLTTTATKVLSPGSTVPLDMSFTNLGSKSVTVTQVTISIMSITTPNNDSCPAKNFSITQAAPAFSLPLAGGQQIKLSGTQTPPSEWPSISMLNSTANQDSCKGVGVVLSYTARGNNP